MNHLKGLFMARGRAAKYKSIRVTVDGIQFASKLEAHLYAYLKMMMNKGILSNLRTQVPYYLTDARIRYVADFEAFNHQVGATIAYEAKGMELPAWRIKRKLWSHYGPYRLFIYKRQGTNGLILSEAIVPKTLLGEKKK
jgi:dsDNA-binding SOS-regulon protein